jgi:hypothetical protein
VCDSCSLFGKLSQTLDSLDGDDVRPSRSVEQRLNEWVMLARTKALAAQGRVFEARNEALRWPFASTSMAAISTQI